MSVVSKRASFNLLVGASITALAVPQAALAQAQTQPPADDTAAAKQDATMADLVNQLLGAGDPVRKVESVSAFQRAVG